MIKLRELFDNPLSPIKTKDYSGTTEDFIEKTFNINGVKYILYISHRDYFTLFDAKYFENIKLEEPFRIVTVEFAKTQGGEEITDISPGNSPLKVFGSIINSIKRSVNDRDIIRFTAKTKETSRVKLYNHLVKRFSGDVYVLKTIDNPYDKTYFLIPKVIIGNQV